MRDSPPPATAEPWQRGGGLREKSAPTGLASNRVHRESLQIQRGGSANLQALSVSNCRLTMPFRSVRNGSSLIEKHRFDREASAGPQRRGAGRTGRPRPVWAARGRYDISKIVWRTAGRGAMEADYVVIGAGSAGCVVASRLSEDGARARPARSRAARPRSDDPYPGRRAACPQQPQNKLEFLSARPSRAAATGGCNGRAARRSAAPARSTACSTCAATRPIMITGRKWAAAAGAMTRCCRSSASPRPIAATAIRPTATAAAR